MRSPPDAGRRGIGDWHNAVAAEQRENERLQRRFAGGHFADQEAVRPEFQRAGQDRGT